jgi:hypothetical protein
MTTPVDTISWPLYKEDPSPLYISIVNGAYFEFLNQAGKLASSRLPKPLSDGWLMPTFSCLLAIGSQIMTRLRA